MGRNIPLPGTFYKYTDGNICQIMCIAKNYADKEMEVIYQKMFPPFDIWEEPLSRFMEKMDICIQPGQDCSADQVISDDMSVCVNVAVDKVTDGNGGFNGVPSENAVSGAEFKAALLNGTVDRKISGRMPDSEIAQKGFMELLDAETYHDKYLIFLALRKYLDSRLLNNIAAALDVVLEDGDEEEQYDSIRRCLQTFEHYETSRLR